MAAPAAMHFMRPADRCNDLLGVTCTRCLLLSFLRAKILAFSLNGSCMSLLRSRVATH